MACRSLRPTRPCLSLCPGVARRRGGHRALRRLQRQVAQPCRRHVHDASVTPLRLGHAKAGRTRSPSHAWWRRALEPQAALELGSHFAEPPETRTWELGAAAVVCPKLEALGARRAARRVSGRRGHLCAHARRPLHLRRAAIGVPRAAPERTRGPSARLWPRPPLAVEMRGRARPLPHIQSRGAEEWTLFCLALPASLAGAANVGADDHRRDGGARVSVGMGRESESGGCESARAPSRCPLALRRVCVSPRVLYKLSRVRGAPWMCVCIRLVSLARALASGGGRAVKSVQL